MNPLPPYVLSGLVPLAQDHFTLCTLLELRIETYIRRGKTFLWSLNQDLPQMQGGEKNIFPFL